VLLYTDGVTEARSPDGRFFGLNRLVDMLGRHLAGDLPPPEIMRRCVRSLLAFQQDELLDDVTLLLVEWRSRRLSRLLP
jgi:serine phosphatase RsbU (regulator of sigma subunit)